MKKIIAFSLFVLVAVTVEAVPARPNTHRQFALTDGTLVAATLHGDEFGHWWQTDDGKCLQIADDGTATFLTPLETASLTGNSSARRFSVNMGRRNRRRVMEPAQNSVAPGGMPAGTYDGSRRGLVILVNFSNLSMQTGHTQTTFDDMFNKEGYDESNHIGSVHDYFYDQSYGKFDLNFDVVGPVTLSRTYGYYGANDSYGEDKYPATMVIEACKLADEAGTDFSVYDWDGDGEVDQVYVIYAGYSEAAGAPSNTIWPHEWTLSEAAENGDGDGVLTLDGVDIDTYACSSELANSSGSTLCSIGTACHEFSHCLGYMDLYDTNYSGGWGMQAWDIMDYGSYSGPDADGEVPTGFSAYERWVAGWLEPVVLTSDMEVTDLRPLNECAEACVIYNDNHPDECYILENRLNTRWFSYWENYTADRQGMLISHLDYDASAWADNAPNNVKNHQRFTVFQANNKKGVFNGNYYNISQEVYSGHLYPYNTNDSLTVASTPAASVFNLNSAGTKYMQVPVRDIKVNSDQTISFNTRLDAGGDTSVERLENTVGTASEATETGELFNLSGQRINGNAKGMVIVCGRKVIK